MTFYPKSALLSHLQTKAIRPILSISYLLSTSKLYKMSWHLNYTEWPTGLTLELQSKQLLRKFYNLNDY